jgi:hypothetical protein
MSDNHSHADAGLSPAEDERRDAPKPQSQLAVQVRGGCTHAQLRMCVLWRVGFWSQWC